jgi:hypothetical protein
MPRSVFVVFTRPASPEREADYNEWYDNTHLPEVLALPGLSAAARYKASPAQAKGMEPSHPYLSIYEIDGDPQQAIDTMMAAARSMNLGDCLDFGSAQAFVFDEITPRRTAPAG